MYIFDNPYDVSEIEKIFLEKPLTLMRPHKIQYIIETIKKFKVNNILEVGTFAAGTSYILSKELPDVSVTSIDVNKFEEYFTMFDHHLHLQMIQEWYPQVDIDPSSIVKIQQIYNKAQTNLKLLEGDWHQIDISNFDCIIIDGDHDSQQVTLDLQNANAKMKTPGIIIVDDCLYEGIKTSAQNFCISNNLSFSFECYYTIDTVSGKQITGNDLCIIKKD